jgi:hypothetical protein
VTCEPIDPPESAIKRVENLFSEAEPEAEAEDKSNSPKVPDPATEREANFFNFTNIQMEDKSKDSSFANHIKVAVFPEAEADIESKALSRNEVNENLNLLTNDPEVSAEP